MAITRRQFNAAALSAVPVLRLGRRVQAQARINSRISGVRIGAITYSFRSMPDPNDIIKAYVTIGLGEMELMSGDAEKLAGAPSGRGTPLRDWRAAATEATFRPVRQKIESAGIALTLLCYNMNVVATTDTDINAHSPWRRALAWRHLDVHQAGGEAARAVRREAPDARRLHGPLDRSARRGLDGGRSRQ